MKKNSKNNQNFSKILHRVSAFGLISFSIYMCAPGHRDTRTLFLRYNHNQSLLVPMNPKYLLLTFMQSNPVYTYQRYICSFTSIQLWTTKSKRIVPILPTLLSHFSFYTAMNCSIIVTSSSYHLHTIVILFIIIYHVTLTYSKSTSTHRGRLLSSCTTDQH